MGEPPPNTTPAAPTRDEGETGHPDYEADFETCALHSSPHTSSFQLAQRFGDANRRRVTLCAALVGPTVLLAVVTRLPWAV